MNVKAEQMVHNTGIREEWVDAARLQQIQQDRYTLYPWGNVLKPNGTHRSNIYQVTTYIAIFLIIVIVVAIIISENYPNIKLSKSYIYILYNIIDRANFQPRIL